MTTRNGKAPQQIAEGLFLLGGYFLHTNVVVGTDILIHLAMPMLPLFQVVFPLQIEPKLRGCVKIPT